LLQDESDHLRGDPGDIGGGQEERAGRTLPGQHRQGLLHRLAHLGRAACGRDHGRAGVPRRLGHGGPFGLISRRRNHDHGVGAAAPERGDDPPDQQLAADLQEQLGPAHPLASARGGHDGGNVLNAFRHH
jgi:hypothetical protein